jgi:methionyl-tRNA synthetase
MEQNHLDRALKKIMEFSSFFNQYFQHKEPWKNGPGTTNCVFLSVNAVRSMAIAIFSFMPESAQKIWNQMGLDGNVSDLSWTDMSDLGISSGHTLGDASPLFARVEASDIENHKKELGPASN